MKMQDQWNPCNDAIANQNAAETAVNAAMRPCAQERCTGTGEDYGPSPYTFDLERATNANQYFRRVIWTGRYIQLTLMCIPPCGEIGLEMHAGIDQFLRIEGGSGRVSMGPTETSLNYNQNVYDGHAVFIPAGTWHNLRNTGPTPIKLYSIYSRVQHPAGTIQCTKADADAAE